MTEKHPEYQYLDLLRDILKNGEEKPIFGVERVTIRSVFGRQIRFNLSKGFPLLTTKKVFLRGIIEELIWFLKGDTNIKYLVDKDVHIWDDWAYKNYKKAMERGIVSKLSQEKFIAKIKKLPKNSSFVKKWGELGPIYGAQWRRWPSGSRKVDQLEWAINELKTTPFRKSILVSAWNAGYIYEMAPQGKSMAIAPCHVLFQFNVSGKRLSMQLYQRSADMFLGVPFNIASYSLLLMMVAQVTGFEAGDFVHTFGDAHIYSNHFDQVKEQIKRKPKPFPKMIINPKVKKIGDFRPTDFKIKNYNPYPPLKAPITVVGGF